MADQALRDTARRYRETRDPSDRLAWLRACLRAGGEPRAQVELAAHALDPVAIEAVDGAAPDADELRRRRRRVACDLRGWSRRLADWGLAPCVHATLAVGQLVHGPESASEDHAAVVVFGGAHSDQALVAAEAQALTAAAAWLRAPAAELERAARRAVARVDAQRGQHPLTRWRRAFVASGPARVLAAEPGAVGDLTGQLIALGAVVWTEGPVFEAAAAAIHAGLTIQTER